MLRTTVFVLTLLSTWAALNAGPALNSLAIHYQDGELSVLDQQKLPQEESWIDVKTPEEMVDIIVSLKVRGAPLIGIAACLSLAQMAEQGATQQEILRAAALLKSSRPTAVNLAIYIERILQAMQESDDYRLSVLQTTQEIFHEDIALCNRIGENGASLIQDGERILTICNTGGLATAGIGTAFGVLLTAQRQGKNIHVYACETRPLLQGGRLTSWELERMGIPYTLICDSMAATLMKSGKIDRVLVGADRIAANGDFANKIGTYNLAVLAHHHNIPFHTVAPYTTVDLSCPNGHEIKIEQRSAEEVRGVQGSFGKVRWAPANASVYNPAFDVTPADLVTSYILDGGVLKSEEIKLIQR